MMIPNLRDTGLTRVEDLASRVALAVSLGALVVVALIGATAAAAAPGATPRFEAAACPAELPPLPAMKNARCGYLTVPENRRLPSDRAIQLAVAIISARSGGSAPDPLVHLTGGPGGLALLEAQTLVDAGFNRDRDLILIEQRGTKYSKPELTCPEIDRFQARLVGMPFDSVRATRAHLAATRACRERLRAEGIEVSAYNTIENAADVADLRRALGIAEWNVFGVSYGTELALTVLRDHPEGIRSVILDSVVPPSRVKLGQFWPNASTGFDHFFKACADQPRCRRAYPHLRDTFRRLVRRLERQPLRTKAADPITHKRRTVVLDGGALANWLVNRSFYTPTYTEVPGLIADLAAGRPQGIAESRLAGVTPPGYVGYGLAYGVTCSEWAPFGPQGEVLAAGKRVLPAYPSSVLSQPPQFTNMYGDCGIWDVPRAPVAIRAPTRSDVPVLLFSGSFDAVTPLRWARDAARTLSNSHVVSIPGVGHFAVPESPCAQSIAASFWDRPDAPDTRCARGLRPAPFTVPSGPARRP